MSTTKYTPAPHFVRGVNTHTVVENFHMIYAEDLTAPTAYVASQHDAKLYAASADLLEALKSLQDWIRPDSGYWGSQLNSSVEAAIKKAEGS